MIWAALGLAGLVAAAAMTAVVLAIRNGGLRAELAVKTAEAQAYHGIADSWRKTAGERLAEKGRWQVYATELEKEIEDAEKLCSAGGDPGDARDALLRVLSKRSRRPGADPGGVDRPAVSGSDVAAAGAAGRRVPGPVPD